jgi:DNA-binding IclR family transcriptional regulator
MGTVGKALAIMDRVAEQGRPVRFAELRDMTGFPKATLHRLLQTLIQQGMLRHDDTAQTYAPGLRVVRFAHAAWAQSSLGPIARPHIEALSCRVSEVVHLGQLDRGQVLYVDKCQAGRPIRMFAEAGKIGPGYCTGIGKAMLAFLPPAERAAAIRLQAFYRHTPQTITDAASLGRELDEIRARGYALDREEHEVGIHCVAVPILGAGGRMIGGLSVTASTQHTTQQVLIAMRPALDETAQRIAEAASPWQFPALATQGEGA